MRQATVVYEPPLSHSPYPCPGKRGIPSECSVDNWDPLLTDWERENLEKYRIQWHAKYGHYPEDNPDAVVVVGQSAEHRFTGSHKDGSLPTLLKGSGITRLYSFHRKP